MARCALKLCPYFKGGRKTDKNLKLHAFPKDPQVREMWEDWVLEKHVVGYTKFGVSHGLCSAHFSKESYRPGSVRLKEDAVPSIAPELTADLAFELGMIPKVEVFDEFLANIGSFRRSRKTPCGGVTSPSAVGVAVHDREGETVREEVVPEAVDPLIGLCREEVVPEEVDPLIGLCREEVVPEEVDTLMTDDLCRGGSDVGDKAQSFAINKRKRRRLMTADDSPCIDDNVMRHSTPSTSQFQGGSQWDGIDDSKRESSNDESESSTSEDDSSMEDISQENAVDSSNADAPSEEASDSPRTPTISGKKQRKKPLRYLGDITPGKLATPRRQAKVIEVIGKAMERHRKERHNRSRQLNRLKRKVQDLKSLLKHLTKKVNLPLEVEKLIKDYFDEPAASILSSVINGKKPGRNGDKYDPVVRQFAMTLNYHSPAAYSYVRSKFLGNNLPHPRTLSKWYSTIDAKPGFTEESKRAIKGQVELLKAKGHTLRLALSHDDMCIRQETTYLNNGTVGGFADDGSAAVTDGSAVAKNAWVIMAVAINGSWKLPLGFFFIDSMDAYVRSNLIKRCLEWLYDTGAVVDAMTFDGLSSNISTAECLGAKLQPGRCWQPYFPHPVKEANPQNQMPPIYCILDAAHMVKLWRNVLGNPGITLQDSYGRSISFDYVKELHNVQVDEGLRAGNKLSSKHVNFGQQKMKVYLATQTLSRSVADAIDACRDDYRLAQFRGSEATTHFIRMADTIFDILNSHNLNTSDRFKRALNEHNIAEVKFQCEEASKYIRSLKVKGPKQHDVFRPLLDSIWATGFLGFLVDMTSVLGLYDRLVGGKILTFLPTYKLSQDHLEMFFGAVRSRGGWNNNPTTVQFVAAYRRLLVQTQLRDRKNGNCWPLETIAILTASSKSTEAQEMEDMDRIIVQNSDHCYARALARQGVALSAFVGDVVEYIAGFVVKKVHLQHGCKDCSGALFRETTSGLIRRKTRGWLKSPSDEVLKICRKAESLIRSAAQDRTFLTTKRDVHVARIFREVVGAHPTIFSSLDNHVSAQGPLENHKFCLLKLIITKYVIIRMCWDVRKLNTLYLKEGLRTKATKMVLFQHQ